jgi:peptidoglycan/xylan/chitin deacetylase (PgdA/CDA1 family)
MPMDDRRSTTRRWFLTLGGLALLSACGESPAAQQKREVAHIRPSPPPPSPPAAPMRVQKEPRYALPDSAVPDGKKAVALTLDDGPDPTFTPSVLSLLRKHDITATFFMIGQSAAEHPDIVRSIADDGHRIGTHTWSHPDLSDLPAHRVRIEIERAVDAVATVTGARPTLFRAPYGAWSRTVFLQCAELGQHSIAWNVDPQDWDNPGADRIRSRVLDQVKAGSIVLNHDGGGDRSQTVAALREYLPRLLDAGYRFVGV